MENKIIWIFGDEGGSHQGLRSTEGLVVTYISHSMWYADPHRIEGTRPNLIVNLSKPPSELLHKQRICAIRRKAPIINLYE